MTAGSERTLCSLLDSWSERGGRTAIAAFRDGNNEDWSYRQLASAARAFAHRLMARGTGRLEPVVLCARNSPEWIVAYFGILKAGALPVPVNDLASARELGQIVATCAARRIVTTTRHAAEFRALGGPLDLILLDGDGAEDWRAASAPEGVFPAVRPQDPATLLWTSGTTGTPKGVPLTHRNLLANLDALVGAKVEEARDRVLLPLPLHHAYPFMVGLLLALAVGATVILPASVTGPAIADAGRRGSVTAIIGVPRLYAAMFDAITAAVKARGPLAAFVFRAMLRASIALRRSLGLRLGRILFPAAHAAIGPALRVLASGGAHLDAELGEKLEGLGYEILSGYGLTETSPILTMTPRGGGRLGTEGKAAPGVTIRIASEPGQEFGEVLAQGPNIFDGYWKNDAATRAAFPSDGWFHTGDLGFLDAEGYLHIVGRKSEMIVLPGGEKLFPEDVEAVYSESPLIKEIAVLPEGGKVVALVVPDEAALRDRGTARFEASLREELENLGAKLPRYQRIFGFAVAHEALPRTHLGKLKRHLLGDLYRGAQAPEAAAAPPLSEADRALLSDPAARALRDWLVARYPGKRVAMDSALQLDLGIDSLEWVTLTFELRDRFDVELPEEALSRVVTLRDLIAEILAAKSRQGAQPPAAPRKPWPETIEASRWLAPQGALLRLLAAAIYHCNRAIMRAAFDLKVEGVGKVPAEGPLVIAPNHASYLDAFLVAAALPLDRLRRAHWGGWTGRLFSNRMARLLSRAARVVPVDPDRAPAEGLAFALAVLARGDALIWFPEGRRSPTGEVGPFLRGVGYLVKQSGVGALPVRIVGSFEALPRGRRFPRRAPVTVVFGEPIGPEILEAEGQGPDAFARIADALRTAVVDLAPRTEAKTR